MKTFKEFINEGLTDKMIGKSEEEINQSLSKYSDADKIKKIIVNKFPFNFLPRTSLGICLYREGGLDCSHSNVTELPDKLLIRNGFLRCIVNPINKLPNNLIIQGDLICSYTNITELPDDLIVYGDVIISANPPKIPKGVKGGIKIAGDLYSNIIKQIQ